MEQQLGSGLPLIFKDFIQEAAQALSSSMAGLRFRQQIAAACTGELIGKIQRGQHGHAQRINGAALRCDSAHLGIDARSQVANMLRILAREVIDLVVNFNGHITVGIASFFLGHDHSHSILGASKFQRVQLPEQPLHPLAHLFALGTQGADFFLQNLLLLGLIVQLRFSMAHAFISFVGALFGC
jgi:hypothetical protein